MMEGHPTTCPSEASLHKNKKAIGKLLPMAFVGMLGMSIV